MSSSFAPNFTEGNFTAENISVPENPQELAVFLKTVLEEHARFINRKDTGQYEESEVIINQTYPGATPQQKVAIFRKIVNFGALPNAATKSVAHGLTNFANITFTHIYGTATSNTTGIPLPYSDPSALANQILLNVDGTNVNITTAIDYSSFTSCYVVLEYFRS